MERNALRRIVLNLVENTTGETFPHFDEHLRFREDLRLDSVDLLSLVMDLEERFKTSLSLDELKNIDRVGQLLDLLERLQGTGFSRAA